MAYTEKEIRSAYKAIIGKCNLICAKELRNPEKSFFKSNKNGEIVIQLDIFALESVLKVELSVR